MYLIRPRDSTASCHLSSGVAGCHWSSASPVLRPAQVVQAGQNVTLTCNLTSSTQTTWFMMRSDELLPLLTTELIRLEGTVVTFHSTNRRINSLGNIEDGPVSLEILEVEEEDAGLYFCTGRCARSVCSNRAIQLSVNGKMCLILFLVKLQIQTEHHQFTS